jgi:hypothetical protein
MEKWKEDVMAYLKIIPECQTPCNSATVAKRLEAKICNEKPKNLLDPIVYQRVHNSKPPVPIISQMNPINAHPLYLINPLKPEIV